MAVQFTIKFENKLPELTEAIEHYVIDFMKEKGKELADMLRDDIKGQRFDHKPLSPAYREYKRMFGLDPRILIATGEMVSKITYRVPMAGDAAEVGIFSDLRNATLLNLHEHGTSMMPERSVLRALLQREHDRIFEEFMQGIQNLIDEHTV